MRAFRHLWLSALGQHGQRVAAGSANIPTPTPPQAPTMTWDDDNTAPMDWGGTETMDW